MMSQPHRGGRLLLWVSLALATGAWAEDANFLAIPHLAKAPTLDGKIDQREWTIAAQLPPLASARDGLVRNANSRVYVGWKDDGLYVGVFRRRTVEERSAFLRDDNTADIALSKGSAMPEAIRSEFPLVGQAEMEGSEHYSFVFPGAGKGIPVEVRISPSPDGKLVPPLGRKPGDGWACKTRSTAATWEAEMQIPLSWLGGMAVPTPVTLAWNAGANEKLAEALKIQLVLGREDVACRFAGVGQFKKGQGVEIEMINGGTTPFKTPVQIKVLEDDKVIDQLNLKDAVVPADGIQHFRLVRPWVCGSFRVLYQVGAEGNPVARGSFGFESEGPMHVEVIPFCLAREGYCVRIEAFDEGISDIQWKIHEASGGKILSQAPMGKLVDGKAEAFIETRGVPNGSILSIEARGGDKVLAAHKLVIQHPAELPSWWTTKAGMQPLIPEPYRAIQCTPSGNGQKLDFLMGEYELKGSVLPNRIGVRSAWNPERKDLLRGPILLKARIEGKESVVAGPVNVKESKPEVVHCQSTAVLPGMEMAMDGLFEYDGMEKVTLKLIPSKGETERLDRLWLEIPMRKEFSALLVGLGDQHSGGGPWVLPAEGAKRPFREAISVGDEERRLVWFAENCRGWKLDEKSAPEAIELVREADGAITLRIHLVRTDTPFHLEKAREIVFGLMFTPPKPPHPRPVRHGFFAKSFEMMEEIKKRTGMNSVETQLGYWEPNEWTGILHGWPEVALTDGVRKRRFEVADQTHRLGMRFFPYLAWGLPRKSQVYPLYGPEMICDPVQEMGWGSVAGCWNTPFQDVFISLVNDRIGDAKIDGYRLDAGFADVYSCSSLIHRGYGSQCGWVDDDGKVRPSKPIFAARKAAERGYRLIHNGAHPDGLCMQGRAAGKCPPIWSFLDVSISSEGSDTKIKTIKEIPLEAYRAVNMGEAYGVVQSYWPKAEHVGCDARMGMAYIHNFEPRGMGGLPNSEISYSRASYDSAPWWRLVGNWAKWPDPKTEFWGYWKNGKYVQTGQDGLKASFFVRRGEKMLLAVLNLDRKPVEATLQVNLTDLGFKQAYAQDALTGEDVPIEGSKVRLDLPTEGYRVLKITAQKLPPGLPEKQGVNLLGDFDLATLNLEKLPSGWKADPRTMKVANGILEMADGASLDKILPIDPEKRYVLEVEARVECEDGALAGPSFQSDGLRLTLNAEGTRYASWGSQLPPGKYTTLRAFIDHPANAASLNLAMKGRAKALVRRIGLYPIKPHAQPYEVD